MSKKEKSYSIQDIVTFKIINGDNSLNRLLSNIDIEYKNFESNEISDPDFTIYLGNFTASNRECAILDNEYYVKENYFYCKDSYKTAKWEFELSGFETGDMKVQISTNLLASIVISGFIIDFLICFKMNEKGYPLVHGSCVSRDDRAYIFSAQGGGGKTTTALYSVERGFDFLGDNFVILHKDDVLSFLSPLNLFSFNLTPIVKRNMGFKNKVEFQLKNLLYKMTGLRIVTKVNVNDVFPNSAIDKSKLDSVFLLVPKERFNIEKISRKDLISHLVMNQKVDTFPFLKYIMEYSYMFPESNMATHWDRYEENLRRILNSNITVCKVEVPQRYNMKIYNKILRVIQDEKR